MLTRKGRKHLDFVKIVYSKQVIKGKLQLIPLELYADGTLKKVHDWKLKLKLKNRGRR